MNNASAAIERVITSLDYDFSQFSISNFIEYISEWHARPIIHSAYPLSPGVSGFWVRAPSADYVFYNANAHAIHQAHIALHEVGHIVLEHRLYVLKETFSPELLAEFGLNQPAGRLRRVSPVQRNEADEREAEAFVYCIQKHVAQANRLDALTQPVTSVAAIRRYVDSMAFEG